jgi:hypothetical protein
MKMRQKKAKKKLPGVKRNADMQREKIPLKKRLIGALPFMLSAILLTAFLAVTGSYKAFETSFTDAWMRFDLPNEESEVVIVDIKQSDFDTFFEGQTRPLKPERLQVLIDAIARGEPCVIGVDIDTHFPEYSSFQIIENWKPKVFWVREPKEIPEDTTHKPVLLDILGGKNPQQNEYSGVPLLLDDPSDKVTRRYVRGFETEQGLVPSFTWAIYQFVQQNPEKCPEIKLTRRDLKISTEPLIIEFSRGREGAGRIRLSVSDVLKMSESSDWSKNELLKNKIVLLGGSYLGEDKHDTPIGTMDGMEILANVIETEIKGGGLVPLSGFGVFILIIFDGILLVLLFHFFSFRKAMILCVAAIPILSLMGSLLAYRSFSYWAYFVPIMLFVVFNELKDIVKGYFKRKMISDYEKTQG